jgi:histidinol-phosphate aminotransferase
MSILNLIRSELLENPSSVAGEDQAQLRLHANELPWSVITADSIDLNFYPETQFKIQLQEQLAKRYQINSDQIVLTRGSDDGIDLIVRLFLKARQDAFMQFPPTFSMYAFYVRLQQAQMIQCPLDPLDDFSLTLEQINQSWQDNCKIIMLCNPNNPTGNLMDLDLIASLCEHYKNRSVIVVDEAYMEFANAQSATSLIPQYDNLIVLRTLSKGYGLAALRLGVVIAQSQVIQALNKIMAPYPLSSVVIHLALQALANDDWFTIAIEKIKKARAKLINELAANPLIEKVYPSEANFILLKTPYASKIAGWFAKQGISIRNFPPNSSLEHHLRITVGDEQQNLLVMTALSSFQNRVC